MRFRLDGSFLSVYTRRPQYAGPEVLEMRPRHRERNTPPAKRPCESCGRVVHPDHDAATCARGRGRRER